MDIPSSLVGAACAFLSVGVIGSISPDTLAVNAVADEMLWLGVLALMFAAFVPRRLS